MSSDDASGPRGGTAAASTTDATPAVLTARRGLRSDVAALIEALDHSELLVPLAEPIEGARLGERMALESETRMVPHLLAEEGGQLYCALFTRADILEPCEEALGWSTGGGPLEYCALPAHVALRMVLDVIDEEQVIGVVLNPMHASELALSRQEAASLAAHQPIPLVGYVQHIAEASERTLVAEGEPPPAELVTAVEAVVESLDPVRSYRLERTFNAERDLEPHLTLTLSVAGEVDRAEVADRVFSAVESALPPPGYLDLLFEPV